MYCHDLSWFFTARLASGLCQISGLASASHRPSHLESFWRWTPNFYGFCEVQEKIVEPKNKPYLPYLTWQFGGVQGLNKQTIPALQLVQFLRPKPGKIDETWWDKLPAAQPQVPESRRVNHGRPDSEPHGWALSRGSVLSMGLEG